MDPTTEALGTIASHGILGAICVILFIVTWRLYVEVKKVQESRVTDAQKMAETLMIIQKEHTGTISGFTAVVSTLKESVERLETQLRIGGE